MARGVSMKGIEGVLLIDNLIYGVVTLIEDKANRVILQGIYNQATQLLIERYTRGIPSQIPYFTLELLFSKEGTPKGVILSKNSSIFEESIVFEECIIDWPHIQVPLLLNDSEAQFIRIPIIFRERRNHDHRPQRTNSPRLHP